ncbi:MAG: dihydropteroate synthase [Candidatus Edwardsbacteria bacterium]|nr:dihydropteroate synthase [Candidatus Edwardsbacteria bacterium]
MFWQCGKYKLDTSHKTLVMGILNLTPDSFSDGGRFNSVDKALARAMEMAEQGADIIDIGGESTRPGAAKVSAPEEIDRVVPVIEALAKKTDVPISIDTYKSQVARKALEAGASMVNDISGLRFDSVMASLSAEFKTGLVLMHIKGTPEDMQQDPQYGDLLGEIRSYLKSSIQIALDAGVERSAIAIDPGIGFGKTVEHNLSLIKDLAYFKDMECPILVGVSRKSFIGKLNNDIPATERLPGSLAAAVLAVQNGAAIIRCHDVAETKQALRVARAITTP